MYTRMKTFLFFFFFIIALTKFVSKFSLLVAACMLVCFIKCVPVLFNSLTCNLKGLDSSYVWLTDYSHGYFLWCVGRNQVQKIMISHVQTHHPGTYQM